MKIDRLIGILSVLLQQEKVTAPYLAEKFEVSRRTINRDIEDINRAGIPIVTMQGQNGGISIMDGYKMDKTLLTSSDMQAILAGLKSLDSICGSNRYQQLMDKFTMGNSSIYTSDNHILIDLSSWYKTTLAPKIEIIQNAIANCEKICFCYFSPKGEKKRKIEPYLLVFQWSSWYVWGYCEKRKDYRLFKLNRLQYLTGAGEYFKAREHPDFEIKERQLSPMKIKVSALFEASMKWRLIEEFGLESFTEQSDGKLLFNSQFSDQQYLFSWLLSFGTMVELLEPKSLRADLYTMTRKMNEKYKD